MEFDNPFDTLSYDDKLISEKLGFAYSDSVYKPTPTISMNKRINQKLIEQTIIREQVRDEMNKRKETPSLTKETPSLTKENFIGSPYNQACSCRKSNELYEHDEPLINNKVLLMMVFVLVIFCIIQYINQQQMATNLNDLMSAMCNIMNKPTQSVQPTQPVQPG